ncbi:tryptophan--tRNA ligase [Candidatus Nomurabacteria bacterium RIFOXYC2_FULL_36_8]|nr:MAG: Tryptophan-tRNA ligase [Candidatus Nomurabacteria bacterium GW2011_GWE2_36_115]KKP94189.1 MAG: Tryptophan-tRNA ligase [Candidatus Nomurabacteria bacterium GW2011_GWF2_36_126]KKP96683.1 MAG: Tryptophan-tRNA ligase [Candidatus Nomurabacteria bacterium GW2011_GWD2_36_14]KKP99713.1 MAG: Tryptophan-tRNA ligase [Candidatus Nomurabacteria bacterium GW2011_GWF2_36_19]KKQ05341.1 MAG: Tryptophan-tRNA ligase [Candidatus Nomurabacteria bacterium GW2011_GWF1_36_47]KKQ09021.1 MAG: Tryptophan-tRNA li
MKKRLLSGIQPSGTIHIGNYFGAIKQFVDFQDQYDSSIFIADLHAITTVQNKSTLSSNILSVAMDYLACGLDPKKVCLFKQSDIPEVAELAWYFNCITTMPYLERATAYKDAGMKAKEVNVGLFDYPILMSADILIQDADVVPVGSDQKQHIEYARDTAIKFNNIYGETFKLPEPVIMKEVAIVPGTDGRKMSKSYGNIIPLFGTDEQIRKAVMSIVTDSKSPSEPKNPEECNIFALHKLFLKGEELENLKKRYKDGGLGYKESKDMLYEEIVSFIKPMRENREYYEKNIDEVKSILKEGGEKAKNNINAKMQLIRNNVGVNL